MLPKQASMKARRNTVVTEIPSTIQRLEYTWYWKGPFPALLFEVADLSRRRGVVSSIGFYKYVICFVALGLLFQVFFSWTETTTSSSKFRQKPFFWQSSQEALNNIQYVLCNNVQNNYKAKFVNFQMELFYISYEFPEKDRKIKIDIFKQPPSDKTFENVQIAFVKARNLSLGNICR